MAGPVGIRMFESPLENRIGGFRWQKGMKIHEKNYDALNPMEPNRKKTPTKKVKTGKS